MMLIANIQAELEKSVPLKALFEQPTVRQLAAYMEASAVSGGIKYSSRLTSRICIHCHPHRNGCTCSISLTARR
nr:phosphopantetheine-binding protein [Bacillus subtilis]